jgi:hypothetical protein
MQRAHANIWSFIRCILSEETRFQHLYVQMNIGSKRRPISSSTNGIQKRIDTLMARYNNNDIDVEQLLDNLSLLIAKKA